jgi:hypothetical protein
VGLSELDWARRAGMLACLAPGGAWRTR